MRHTMRIILTLILTIGLTQLALASSHEKKGSPGSGYEQGKADMPPSMKTLSTVESYLNDNSTDDGHFEITDDQGKTRDLELKNVHRKMYKTDDGQYFVHADFKDVNSNEMVDVDFYFKTDGSDMSVTDAKFHKIKGMRKGSEK